jgi:3-phenylpropionate/cinnamic acid dioxygenase small subunit
MEAIYDGGELTMANLNIANVSLETQRAVEQFLYHQAEVADGGRWDEWLGLFTRDGKYWMPAQADQETAEGVPNIFYEDIFLMEMRIKRVLHPNAHSQAPEQRLSRVVSNVMIESEDAATGDIVVRSKFHLVEYRLETQRFFGGKYRHHLKKTDDGYRIQLQRVDIANVEGPFDYVLQTWL